MAPLARFNATDVYLQLYGCSEVNVCQNGWGREKQKTAVIRAAESNE